MNWLLFICLFIYFVYISKENSVYLNKWDCERERRESVTLLPLDKRPCRGAEKRILLSEKTFFEIK